MGLVHLVSLLISFFRWLDRQQSKSAPGNQPPSHSHSVGEAPRVAPSAPRTQAQAYAQVAAQAPTPRQTNAHIQAPARPAVVHRAKIIDDAPNGPVEWLMRRFEGKRD
jgi:hypothetical protein